MKQTTCLLLIVLAVLLSSCASQPSKGLINNETTDISAEAEAVPIPSRESVFIYSGRKNPASRLILTLSGEPVLLSSGYIRLVGVVSGGKPTACLEIGGRGLALEEGETVDDYRIVSMGGDRVVLEREK
jgi:hypothetical protein